MAYRLVEWAYYIFSELLLAPFHRHIDEHEHHPPQTDTAQRVGDSALCRTQSVEALSGDSVTIETNREPTQTVQVLSGDGDTIETTGEPARADDALPDERIAPEITLGPAHTVQTLPADGAQSSNHLKIEFHTTYENLLESFAELNMRHELVRSIYKYGIRSPSPFHQRALIPIILGRDVVIQAVYDWVKHPLLAMGILHTIDTSIAKIQALLLCPRRDQARDMYECFYGFAKHMQVQVHLCIGRTSVQKDIRVLSTETPHVVVGTPGRVYDMMQRRVLDAAFFRSFYLDDADELHGDDFERQVYRIFQFLPSACQIGLFCTTITQNIMDITEKFMGDTVRIVPNGDQFGIKGIRHYYGLVDQENRKFTELCSYYKELNDLHTILFVNNWRKVESLAKMMRGSNFTASMVHSEMSLDDREINLRQFRSGSSRALVATDFPAHGIDIREVLKLKALVINYDCPENLIDYFHRVCRSCHSDCVVAVITNVTLDEYYELENIEEFYNISLMDMPTNTEEMFQINSSEHERNS